MGMNNGLSTVAFTPLTVDLFLELWLPEGLSHPSMSPAEDWVWELVKIGTSTHPFLWVIFYEVNLKEISLSED